MSREVWSSWMDGALPLTMFSSRPFLSRAHAMYFPSVHSDVDDGKCDTQRAIASLHRRIYLGNPKLLTSRLPVQDATVLEPGCLKTPALHCYMTHTYLLRNHPQYIYHSTIQTVDYAHASPSRRNRQAGTGTCAHLPAQLLPAKSDVGRMAPVSDRILQRRE